mgnify:CR=1 FL=1
MDDNKTFKLRYVGSRFTGARMPLNVLSDLPAFRDLLVSFARDEWKERHPERKRVPKGFDASLTLDLTQIEDGSALPNLVWSRDVAQQTLPGFEDELAEIVEESYVDIVQLFEGAANGQAAPELSPDKLRALDKFGAGLLPNERIELTPITGGNVVYLDLERRKRLITSVRETYNVRLTGVGTLASNSVYGHVIIRTDNGDISVPIDPEEIKQNFDGSLDQTVQYDIMVEMDRSEHIRNVVDVFDVADGDLRGRRSFATIAEDDGSPDGLTIAADGSVWVALWGGSAVRGYDASGQLIATIDLPVPQVSACTFGDDDLGIKVGHLDINRSEEQRIVARHATDTDGARTIRRRGRELHDHN